MSPNPTFFFFLQFATFGQSSIRSNIKNAPHPKKKNTNYPHYCHVALLFPGTEQNFGKLEKTKGVAPSKRIVGEHTRHSRYVTGIRHKGKVKILRSPFDRQADAAALIQPTHALPREDFLHYKRVLRCPDLHNRSPLFGLDQVHVGPSRRSSPHGPFQPIDVWARYK